jgi:hypothetical protein
MPLFRVLYEKYWRVDARGARHVPKSGPVILVSNHSGAVPFDAVMMFKILVVQTHNNLSDERSEFLINDRLSFMRFLGLGLGDRVPDARTIWSFRERLVRANAIERLFSGSIGGWLPAISRCRPNR